MTRITVADTVLKAGEPWAHTPVRVELCDSTGTPVAPAYVTATGVIVEPFTTATDADGIFTVQLDPTDAIAPTGCFYGVTIGDVGPIVIRGDQGDGSLRSLRATTPTVLGNTATLSGLSDVDLTGRVDGSVLEWDTATSKWIMGTGGGGGGAPSGPAGGVLSGTYPNPTFAADMATQAELDAHVAAADPHPGYLTAAEGAASFQPLDSDLTAIAALSTTSFGRGLLALADAAALRTSAGLVIGTDIYSKSAVDSGFQPLDSDLTAIAALTTTTFGRSLLALADAAAGRTALGLGSLATLSTITTSEITDGTIVAGDVNSSTLDTDGTLAANSDTRWPSQKATKTYADAIAQTVPKNTQTTDYTLVLADAGKVVEMNAGTLTTLTVPPNSSVAFPVGTLIEVCQLGAGNVAIAAGSGVTIDGGNVTMTAQYGSCLLRKRATDEWVVTTNTGSIIQPGELGSASITSDFTQTGVGNSLVTGLSVTVTVGSRPVKITFSGELKVSTSGSSGAITIEEDGTQIAEGGFVANSANDISTITRTIRRAPTAGTHTYRVRLYSLVAGNATVLAFTNNEASLIVEQI